jgi:mRNA interferase MazF
MTRRADVVIARFPYVGGAGSKVRPAVVVQCDRLNGQIANTLLAMITGNTLLPGVEPTQFLIDPAAPEGASSGLTYASAVKCENLATIPPGRHRRYNWPPLRRPEAEAGRVPEGSPGSALTPANLLVSRLQVLRFDNPRRREVQLTVHP